MSKSQFATDLVFVSLENWDQVWRRNQFLCDTLARRHPAMKILFVGLPRDVSNGLRRRNLSALREPGSQKVDGLKNVTVLKPIKLLPDSFPPGRWLNQVLFTQAVRRECRRLGIAGPTLWINPYTAGHLIGRVGERRVVYDITDDWELSTVTPRRQARIRKMDRDLCKRADLVVVCSTALAESRRPVSKRLLVLPNGVDVEHYRRVSAAPGPIDPPVPRPVFGYTGTLHPDRIDVDLVLAVAKAFPAGTIFLIGPNGLSDADSVRLKSAGNIRLTGPMPYAELPEMMARFDACIVPHRRTAFTQSLNPIKLWEYLAAGKPIVSTPVAGFEDYPELCRLAATAEEFIAACREASVEGSALTERRRAEASRHTWSGRVDRLEEELAKLERPDDRIDEPSGWTAARVAAGISRRVRLVLARFRCRTVRFGRRCDIGRGFRATTGPRGSILLGHGCVIDRGMTLESLGTISIGADTIIGHHCTIAARMSVTIGPGCMIAEMVSIRDHDHRFAHTDRPRREQGFDVEPVRIGSNVWLGGKVSVLKGVTIGDNTVVGAHAVVTRDLPANVVAVGVPARVVRRLDSDQSPEPA